MSEALFRNLNPDFVQYKTQIGYRTQIGVCVAEAMKKRGYIRSEESWDIFWAQKQLLDSVYINNRVTREQKINHYRTYHEICHKDSLNRNLKKYKRTLEREGKTKEAYEYNYFPLAYHLPLQFAIFAEEFKKIGGENKVNIWIMKPTSKSQGKGIFLFNRLSSVQEWAENPEAETYICQKYIQNPLLIGNKKFDLRLYVLCTSYRPLTAYLYREGFARFTHFRYDQTDISNNEVHLTNVAIQKHTSEYSKNLGGKWMVSNLKHYLMSKFDKLDVNTLFYEIKALIIKTLRSVSKIMSNEGNCFELYGFDVLIDKNLKPWLLQVNGSPSMRANTAKDRQLKCGIIDDVLTIIDLQKILTGDEEEVGGFDLICKKDVNIDVESYSGKKMSLLGCMTDRIKSYTLLAKSLNDYHKKQKRVEFEPPSPTKKGFSVRKQKRNSVVKGNQESPSKRINLEMPKMANRTGRKFNQNPNQVS